MSRSSDDEFAFAGVLRQIADSVAFKPGYYNESYLDRRISARMRRCDIADHEVYERRLREDPEEREALMAALTINVTGFFRNPEMWEVFRDVLRRQTTDQRRVRVWSAPCADGREPYSVAMLACDDPEIDERRVEILGTDISEEALEAAREGVYHTTRTTDIAAELDPLSSPADWVDRDEDTFSVTDRVQELVSFDRHDMVQDGAREAFDVVFCRNLLIYIDSEHKGDVFDTLEASLSPGSVLVVGMTESVPPARRDRYEPIDKRRRVFRRQ